MERKKCFACDGTGVAKGKIAECGRCEGLGYDEEEKQLEINTSGWVEIYCDKCNTTNSYDPEYAKTVPQCFGCMPLTSSVVDDEHDK